MRMKCLNCNEMGHFASNCPKPKTCNKCGATDHLFRNCPNEKKTYARAAQECEDEDVVTTVIKELRALVPPAVQEDKAEGMGTPSDSALLEGCNVVSGEVEEAGRMEKEDSDGTQDGTIIPDTIVPGTSASWGEKMEAEDEKEGRWSIAKGVGKRKLDECETSSIESTNDYNVLYQPDSPAISDVSLDVECRDLPEFSSSAEEERSGTEDTSGEYLGKKDVEGFKGTTGFVKNPNDEQKEKKKKK